jgi:hypothetical protein
VEQRYRWVREGGIPLNLAHPSVRAAAAAR